jgi:hypothetical protein
MDQYGGLGAREGGVFSRVKMKPKRECYRKRYLHSTLALYIFIRPE